MRMISQKAENDKKIFDRVHRRRVAADNALRTLAVNPHLLGPSTGTANENYTVRHRFMKQLNVGKLLFQCNAGEEKGIPVMQIFRYLLCLVFSDRSSYVFYFPAE